MQYLQQTQTPGTTTSFEPPPGPRDPEDFVRFLLQGEIVTTETHERVLRIGRETGDSVAAILLNSGLIAEGRIAAALATWSGLSFVDSLPSVQEPVALEVLRFCRTHEVVLIDRDASSLTVAVWDALSDLVPRALEFSFGLRVYRVVTTRTAIRAALAAFHGDELEDEVPVETLIEEEEVDRLRDLASEEPVIRLAQRIIGDAIVAKVSDIHLEPTESGLRVRYRQDGLLHNVNAPTRGRAGAVISRIKVMAGLDIAERRLPQDGRIRVTVAGRDTDLRVATAPTLHGEGVVLRILDRQDVALDFAALGFDARVQEQLREAVNRPHGIVLITGPTGSGKTTTLYAALKSINAPDKKILTVEDPVEYTLEGINQVPVRAEIGLTFARALRAFLRQDPDVLMVGEIRDRETAEVAIQAALTGHLLLSTLHTNTAAGAVTRLLDMGLDDYLLTSTLDLIVGQRLVRKLCQVCRESYEPSSEVRRQFGLPDDVRHWWRPRGCTGCRQSGWLGRTSIVEVLSLNDDLRARILAGADAHTLEREAVRHGMIPLNQHGLQLVNLGVTTVEELLRVTRLN